MHNTLIPSYQLLEGLKKQKTMVYKGYSLLRRKRDMFTKRLLEIGKQVKELQYDINDTMEDVGPIMTKAKYILGNYRLFNIRSMESEARYRVGVESQTKFGIHDIKFEPIKQDKTTLFGLDKGRSEITNVQKRYTEILDMCLPLASLRIVFINTEEKTKILNRQLNALDKIVKPKLDESIRYVSTELDEMEREENYRFKRLIKKKLLSKKKKLEWGY
ncbi:ATPase V1 complex subunit D [Fadolivirus algeromassiliense]|jgi:V-type H+-transporting ATPase subunit D|uniref:ATPase V1 complex subunit D n=1 Tax=Fadolivirus FV1/VV64 TaxID=3070911 RepID=A0A7D3UTZ0_9VIRU|nr:ATPase V1 complex subunit D [Fadolivirus algeromassiliense]QKF94710.1 ATPase V1 complex subunit D [Fadolivirus FV1/VV64]